MDRFFEFFQELNHYLVDPGRLPVVVVALFLTAVFGMITGPRGGMAYPLYWLLTDKLFGGIGARLDRRQRKVADLAFRGFLLTIVVIVVSFMIGVGARWLADAFYLFGMTEIVILSLLMTSGSVWFALSQLYFAQKEEKKSKGAYYAIARSTRTDLSGSDQFTVTRTGMGLAARAFDKGMVAPALWYFIAGLPGAFIYAGLAAVAWRFGRDGFSKGFGSVPLALERLLGFVPTVFSGILMAIAGLFTPTGSMARAVAGVMKSGNGKAPYEQGGLPVTAMAYALKINLGGPAVDLDGRSIKRAWVGPPDSTAKLENGHLRRAIYISLMAHLLFIAGCLGAVLFAG